MKPRALSVALVVAALAALTAAPPSLVACRPAPGVPCRVDESRALAVAPAGATLVPGPGDTLILGALHTGLASDGGADDASAGTDDGGSGDGGLGDGGDAGPTPPRQRLPDRFDVAVLDAGGNVTARAEVPAPSSLRARAGSTSDVAAVWTGEGALFRWSESRIETADDGTRTSSLRLVAAFVGADGTELPPFEVASCTSCTLGASAAATRDAVVLVWLRAASANDTGLGAEKDNALGFASFTSRGVLTRTGGAPQWLATNAASDAGDDAGPSLLPVSPLATRIESLGDDLLLRTARQGWLVDATFTPVAGPVPLTNGAALAWNRAQGDVAVASTGGAVSAPSAAVDPVGDAPDVLFRRYDDHGSARTSLTRMSTGDLVTAVAGDATSGYGVLLLGGGRPYFAYGDGLGRKIGGDLDLGGPGRGITGDGADASAPTLGLGAASPLVHRLAFRDGRFVDTSIAAGSVVREEIVCAP